MLYDWLLTMKPWSQDIKYRFLMLTKLGYTLMPVAPAQDDNKMSIHRENGIGILCNDTKVCINIDVKNFSSQEDCDINFNAWLNKYPLLKHTWIESTGSGGYHVFIELKGIKNFSKCSFTEGGVYVGEALGNDKFVVIAPTIGTAEGQFKDYEVLQNFGYATAVDSLESIGIYPYKGDKAKGFGR